MWLCFVFGFCLFSPEGAAALPEVLSRLPLRRSAWWKGNEKATTHKHTAPLPMVLALEALGGVSVCVCVVVAILVLPPTALELLASI